MNAGGRLPHNPAIAVLSMIACAALVAMTTLLAKFLGQDILGPEPLHPLQVSAGRFIFAWLTLLPFVLWRRPRFKGARWTLHGARSLCGWAGVSCMFAAAAAMPLADATAISFLNPIIAMVLAIVLLGERVGPWRWGAAAISLIGAALLIRPGTDSFQAMALVALAAALFMGFEVIFIKMLTNSEFPLRILFINNTIGAVLSLGAAAFVWTPPSSEQWLALAAIGMIMVSAQTMFINAMRQADASFAMPFFYATLVFAAVYDIIAFSVVPAALSIAGAVLVIAGAIVLGWREGRVGRG